MIDHYKVLGLPSGEEGRSLTSREIRKAYELKALNLHPDKRLTVPDAVVKFQKLMFSYEFLMDEQSRIGFEDLLRSQRSSSSSQGGFRCDDIPESLRESKMRSDLEQKLRKAFNRRVEEEIARFREARRRNYRARKTDEFQSPCNKSDDNCRCDSEAPKAKKTLFRRDLEAREKRTASVMKASLKREEERISKYFQDNIARARAMRENKSD